MRFSTSASRFRRTYSKYGFGVVVVVGLNETLLRSREPSGMGTLNLLTFSLLVVLLMFCSVWCQEVLEEFLRLFPLLFSATQNARFCQAITSSFERRQWNRLSKGLRNAAKMAIDKVRSVVAATRVFSRVYDVLFCLHC